MSDISVNVTSAGAANVAVSNGSAVTATVGNGGAVNVAVGTISPGNATVVSGTVVVNSTQTLSAGASAFVKNAGSVYAAKLDFGIPTGQSTTVSVGNTTTLAAGSNATVTGTTNGSTLTLAFGIPAGASGSSGNNGTNGLNGVTPSFSIGTVTTGAAGSSATVTATSSNAGANVLLDFTIPRGADGSAGSGSGNLTLSDATPSALGTAAAGTSNSASRADHTHQLPTIAYDSLSGRPTNFPTNTSLVSGISSYSLANHAHNYVTALNNLAGNVTLAAGGNVTLSANGSTLTISASGGGGVSQINSLTGNVVLDGLEGMEVVGYEDGGPYLGLRVLPATAQDRGGIRVGSGLTITGDILSVTGGGGGSASVNYDYATTADLPASGNAALLYCTTDTGRLYRWTGTVYAEVGPIN